MNITALLNKKGQIATITTKRNVKVRKGYQPIEKISTFQCRIGVDYDHIKDVIVKRDNGKLPKENAGLPYGKWKMFPVLLEHNGNEYLRCSTINSKMKIAPKYYRNGNEINADDVKKEALASEFTDKELDVFNIKVENIIDFK